MPIPRVILGTLVLIAVMTGTPALASRTEGASLDDSGITAEVSVREASSGSAPTRRKGANGPQCHFTLLPSDLTDLANTLAKVGYVDPKGDFEGVWYQKDCIDDGLNTRTVSWRKPPSAKAPVDTSSLAEQALQRAPIPLPGLGMNPPADREQVVGLPVLLWMDPDSWKPVSASASAGGTTVTVEAAPVQVKWIMGNGDSVTCGAGTPYDASRSGNAGSDCSYTYRRSSDNQPNQQFQVTATAEWRARWRSTSGASGDLGTVTRTSTVPIRVTELQAINTVPSS